MEYRILPHGGEKISVIGLGTGSITGTEEQMVEILHTAMDHGVNFFDLASIDREPFFGAFAKTIKGRREQVYIQTHFGMIYKDGRCESNYHIDNIKAQFEADMAELGTDYTDFALIHCIDDHKVLNEILNGPVFAYIKELKAQGRVRHIGFSSHEVSIARRILDTGVVDLFMFSLNPAYDYEQGSYTSGTASERAELYRIAESLGAGITVMKPFGGGRLLDAKTSNFGRALTQVQCIQYELDRPAVLAVLPGVRDMKDLQTILHYQDATDEEKDYSVINEFTPQNVKGACVYCNHCMPCPMNINIGLVNKYYDLAQTGDEMAADHYRALPVKAEDCIHCGGCETRCPFAVKQESRMSEIAEYFASR